MATKKEKAIVEALDLIYKITNADHFGKDRGGSSDDLVWDLREKIHELKGIFGIKEKRTKQ